MSLPSWIRLDKSFLYRSKLVIISFLLMTDPLDHPPCGWVYTSRQIVPCVPIACRNIDLATLRCQSLLAYAMYRPLRRQMRAPDQVEGRHLPGTVMTMGWQNHPDRSGSGGSALRLLLSVRDARQHTMRLFQQQHLAAVDGLTGGQAVKIDATCYRFVVIIAPVPICLVTARWSQPTRQCGYPLP